MSQRWMSLHRTTAKVQKRVTRESSSPSGEPEDQGIQGQNASYRVYRVEWVGSIVDNDQATQVVQGSERGDWTTVKVHVGWKWSEERGKAVWHGS